MAFQTFMGPVMNLGIFPDELQDALARHLIHPKASTFSDAKLMAIFRKHEKRAEPSILVSHFNTGDVIVLRGKRYRIGPLRRTRFLCTELKSGKTYLIPGDMEVDLPPTT